MGKDFGRAKSSSAPSFNKSNARKNISKKHADIISRKKGTEKLFRKQDKDLKKTQDFQLR